MASTLREELASLRIERTNPLSSRRNGNPKSSGRGGGGLRLLSWVLWLIPLSLLTGVATVGIPAVRSDPLPTRSERGFGPIDDGRGSGEAPDRQGISQVALSVDDRDQDRGPG